MLYAEKKEERQTGAGVGDFERGWWGWGEGCSLEGLVWEGILKGGGGGGGGKACSWKGLVWEGTLRGGLRLVHGRGLSV